MSRLHTLATEVMRWEHTNWRLFNECIQGGLNPSKVHDIKGELRSVLTKADYDLTRKQIDCLVEIELKGL